ncbi:hypothetical protein CDIK_3854 [Cucumispora dikerogammari]|nr:hypothetical protein CDIK_3854 [Cucumispora dikerogammari]
MNNPHDLLTTTGDNSVRYTSYSNEKRRNLIRLVEDQGFSIKTAANNLEINYNPARSVIAQFRQTGKVVKSPKGGKNKILLSENVCRQVENIVSEHPLYTLKKMWQRLLTTPSISSISLETIARCLIDLGITIKLSHRESDRVNALDKIEARKEYGLWFSDNFSVSQDNVVYLDETSFNLHNQRLHARSTVGTRANVLSPTIRDPSVTLICSISNTRICLGKVISNSTVNSDIFSGYLEKSCSFLKDILGMDGGCIILDNARIYRRITISEITARYSFSFHFLFPYSYMLNPIETAFLKIENAIRSKIRLGSQETLAELIYKALFSINADDCKSFF